MLEVKVLLGGFIALEAEHQLTLFLNVFELLVEGLHCLENVGVPKGFELAELLDEFDGGLQGQLIDDLGQQFEDIELEDGVGGEDDIGEDELLVDYWQPVLDVLEVACIADVQARKGHQFIGKEHQKQLHDVADLVIEDGLDLEIEQAAEGGVLLERESLEVLQLLGL